jgi:DNA-binding transcriptional LysR family regulator
MDLRHLEYFVAVAEEASFTRAATRLHVSQPGVSAQVRQLERELGEDLFDRSGRVIRLTGVGEAVLGYARSALAAAAGVRVAVDEISGLVRGSVRVGMVVACSAIDVPDLLAAFHRQHPNVDISLTEANSDQLIAALVAGELDLAYVALGPDTPPGIATRILVDEPMVAVVGPDDPLARAGHLDLAELGRRAVISLPPGTGVRALLDEACAAAGIRPRIALVASNLGIVAALAARGLGLAIVPASVAASGPAGLCTLPIDGPELRGRIALAWRSDGPMSPTARALVRDARALVRDARA